MYKTKNKKQNTFFVLFLGCIHERVCVVTLKLPGAYIIFRERETGSSRDLPLGSYGRKKTSLNKKKKRKSKRTPVNYGTQECAINNSINYPYIRTGITCMYVYVRGKGEQRKIITAD